MVSELAEQFGVPPNQTTTWRSQLLEGDADVLGEETKPDPTTAVDLKSLHAKIGELTLEKRFFSWCTREGGPTAEHKTMIDRSYVLSLSRQAIALGISRWSVYYQAEPVSESDMRLLRRIDQLHLDYPFAGS